MKTLVLAGNDKLGRYLLSKVAKNHDLLAAVDQSSTASRIIKLLRRRSLTLPMVCQMAIAEWLRPDTEIEAFDVVRSNADLLALIEKHHVQRVYLFRAGLIVNKRVIETRAEILNTHCASIERYGGIGSIYRALSDGAYDQAATLHRITTRIDEGEVIAQRAYRLDPAVSYAKNEEIAYQAGIELLVSHLERETS